MASPRRSRRTARRTAGNSGSNVTNLGSVQTDDPIDIPGAIEEVGDGDGVLAGGNPVLLGVWIDLEDVGPGAEDGLLPVQTGGKSLRVLERLQRRRKPGSRLTKKWINPNMKLIIVYIRE